MQAAYDARNARNARNEQALRVLMLQLQTNQITATDAANLSATSWFLKTEVNSNPDTVAQLNEEHNKRMKLFLRYMFLKMLTLQYEQKYEICLLLSFHNEDDNSIAKYIEIQNHFNAEMQPPPAHSFRMTIYENFLDQSPTIVYHGYDGYVNDLSPVAARVHDSLLVIVHEMASKLSSDTNMSVEFGLEKRWNPTTKYVLKLPFKIPSKLGESIDLQSTTYEKVLYRNNIKTTSQVGSLPSLLQFKSDLQKNFKADKLEPNFAFTAAEGFLSCMIGIVKNIHFETELARQRTNKQSGAAVKWISTGIKVLVNQKGPDHKFHTVPRSIYTHPEYPGEQRVIKNKDGKRIFVAFKSIVSKIKKNKSL